MPTIRKTIVLLTVFSIAMGLMEAAVVIYLRQIYYPTGFDFPLIPIEPKIAVVEFLREAATIIMLACIGVFAGINKVQRFSFFLFCFAVWDIFYYIFLKIFLDWPESLMTNDILFLIPVMWVGPVLAPCLLSLTMISLTLAVVYFHERDVAVTINIREWILLIAGALTVIFSFTIDYIRFMQQGGHSAWTPASNENLFNEVSKYVPQSFYWEIFAAGELLIVAAIAAIMLRHKKQAV